MQTEIQEQKPTTISEDDYRLLTAWRDTLRGFMTASKRILKQADVTTSEYQALLVIRLRTQQQQLSMGELARHLHIRNNSAVSLVNRLARQGLARRVPSDQDSRIVHLRLTIKGESALRKLVGAHRRELERISPSLRNILS
ncbi:MAG: MarR family transcriptional regulator [Gammaproteobacteria bacterium]